MLLNRLQTFLHSPVPHRNYVPSQISLCYCHHATIGYWELLIHLHHYYIINVLIYRHCWVKYIQIVFKYKIRNTNVKSISKYLLKYLLQMYLKYKVQKYIYVLCILQNTVQNTKWSNYKEFFSNDINDMVQTLSLLTFNKLKQIVLTQKQQYLKRSIWQSISTRQKTTKGRQLMRCWLINAIHHISNSGLTILYIYSKNNMQIHQKVFQMQIQNTFWKCISNTKYKYVF